MFPTIDKKETGIHLRKIMDERGYTAKDVQEYLNLGSVQSVYHWLNGTNLPTIDNLYALSEMFGVTVDDLLCGNRKAIPFHVTPLQYRRIRFYTEMLETNHVA